jgi:hypothetical protein
MHISVPRGARRLLRAPVLTLPALVTVVALAAPASAGTVSAGSLLNSSRSAMAKQTSAHVEFRANSTSSSLNEKIVADVGVTSGMESVSNGAASLTIRVTPAAAYVRGSATGLTSLFGLTAAQAKKLGSHWESWKPGTTQYASFKSNVTVTSLKALLPNAKGTTLTAGKGTKPYLITWTSPATKTTPQLANALSISSNGTFLPLQVTANDASGVKVTTSLSKWGETVTVPTPAAASTVASSTIKG